MKIGEFRYSVVFCSFVLLGSMAGFVGASDIGAVVKKDCSMCHSTKRICLNLGVKSEAAWKATIIKMVGKGSQLSADTIDAAAGYLSNLAPGTGTVCQ